MPSTDFGVIVCLVCLTGQRVAGLFLLLCFALGLSPAPNKGERDGAGSVAAARCSCMSASTPVTENDWKKRN